MGLVLGWHGIVFQMTEDDQATTRAVKADKVALVVLVAFYLAFNVIFLAVNLFRVSSLQGERPFGSLDIDSVIIIRVKPIMNYSLLAPRIFHGT